jgi:hypothetical protein
MEITLCDDCDEPAEYRIERDYTCDQCGHYTYYTTFYCEKHINDYDDKDCEKHVYDY